MNLFFELKLLNIHRTVIINKSYQNKTQWLNYVSILMDCPSHEIMNLCHQFLQYFIRPPFAPSTVTFIALHITLSYIILL